MTATTAVAKNADDVGALPEWDLSDLFTGPDDPALSACLDEAETEAGALEADYKGRLAGLSGDELAALIRRYEALSEKRNRVMSFAYLYYCTDMASPKRGQFLQSMRERITDISTRTLFVTLELNRIEDDVLEPMLESPDLGHYRPWIRDQRIHRPHQLSDDMEQLLHEKYVAGRAAWTRLFDETIAGLRFEVAGETLTEAQAMDKLSSANGETRRIAAAELARVFNQHAGIFALVTNTLAKDKEIEDRWRRFPRPISDRNLANVVEDEVVDALIAAVRDSYPRLSHRYYALKARWMGVERLDYWDRNAPLPDQDDRKISWDEAKATVLDAYGAFSPDLAAVGQKFFENDWIHASVREGKASGAFAHPTVPSVHPYLLLNYQGKVRDVMTLAHELGHGVHQILAGAQGTLLADTPLTLAETASVFGEQLTFRALLNAESDPVRRRVMLAGKIEDMINTVVRQVAFCSFEQALHDARRKSELTAEEIGDIWMTVQTESLGPAIRLHDDYRIYWCYIPHFVHTPFYVYAYAFGDCLVNALYAVYQNAESGFQEKYLDMLRAGGSKRHRELLAPFGLDAGDPRFWDKGLSVIEGLIDELAETF